MKTIKLITLSIMILAIMQITGLTTFPVYFWIILLSGLAYTFVIIERPEEDPAPILYDSRWNDEIKINIWKDWNNDSLIQIIKGDDLFAAKLTVRMFKMLVRGEADLKYCFDNPFAGKIHHTNQKEGINKLIKTLPIELESGFNPFVVNKKVK